MILMTKILNIHTFSPPVFLCLLNVSECLFRQTSNDVTVLRGCRS